MKAGGIYELFSIGELVKLYENLQRDIERREPISNPKNVKLMNDNVSNMMMANDGLLQHIVGADTDGQLQIAWTANQSGEDSIPVTFSLSYDNLSPAAKRKLDPFDITIINHVGSLLYYQMIMGKGTYLDITARELWGVITGAKDLSKVSVRPEKLEQLDKHLERLDDMKLDMDITEEILNSKYKFKDERLISGIVQDRMIHRAKVSFKTSKGRLVSGYRFFTLPILFAYCLSKKHTITVPAKYMEIDGRTDERTIAFRDYLVKEIVRARRGDRRPIFLINTIYEKTGTPTPKERVETREAQKADSKKKSSSSSIKVMTSQELAKDCERVSKIFDTWKRNGIIAGYSQSGRGMKTKFTVALNMPNLPEK